jgi:hypothetical protein
MFEGDFFFRIQRRLPRLACHFRVAEAEYINSFFNIYLSAVRTLYSCDVVFSKKRQGGGFGACSGV